VNASVPVVARMAEPSVPPDARRASPMSWIAQTSDAVSTREKVKRKIWVARQVAACGSLASCSIIEI
jgi:hypothetical protein